MVGSCDTSATSERVHGISMESESIRPSLTIQRHRSSSRSDFTAWRDADRRDSYNKISITSEQHPEILRPSDNPLVGKNGCPFRCTVLNLIGRIIDLTACNLLWIFSETPLNELI